MFKISKQRAALKSTLRLLVLLREMLTTEGAEGTDLHRSVVAHANLCGLALPNKDRVSKEELAAIREKLNLKPAPPALPAAGGMVVLRPDQIQVGGGGNGGGVIKGGVGGRG